MRYWHPFVSSLAILSVVSAVHAAPSEPNPEGKLLEQVAAVVNGKIILKSELDETVDQFIAEMKSRGVKEDLGSPAETRKRVLDQMINDLLVEGEIERMGLTVGDAYLDSAIASVMRQNGMASTKELEKALKEQGLTMEGYRVQVRKQIETGRLMNEVIRPKIQVSDTDVTAAYRREQAESPDKTLVNLRMIFKKKRNPGADPVKMKRFLKELEVGIPFEKVADRETEGPGKGEGGSLGLVSPDDLQPEIRKAIADLKAGETSGVIKTSKGSYIVKVLERTKAEPAALTDAGRKVIRERLTAKETERQFDSLIRSLRSKAEIEMLL